jgi:hypothetical protein
MGVSVSLFVGAVVAHTTQCPHVHQTHTKSTTQHTKTRPRQHTSRPQHTHTHTHTGPTAARTHWAATHCTPQRSHNTIATAQTHKQSRPHTHDTQARPHTHTHTQWRTRNTLPQRLSGALLTHEHSKHTHTHTYTHMNTANTANTQHTHSPCITNALRTVQNAVSMMARVLESSMTTPVERDQSRCQGPSSLHCKTANTNSVWRMQVRHIHQLLAHRRIVWVVSVSLSLCLIFLPPSVVWPSCFSSSLPLSLTHAHRNTCNT